jgi:hypothetical protein
MHSHEHAKGKAAKQRLLAKITDSAVPSLPHAFGLMKAAYSVNETLTVLSIGRTSLYNLVKLGKLTPIKLGNKTLFGSDDLAALLTNLRTIAAERSKTGVDDA